MIREQILQPRQSQARVSLTAAGWPQGGERPPALALGAVSAGTSLPAEVPRPLTLGTQVFALSWAQVFLACKINGSAGLKTVWEKGKLCGCCDDDLTKGRQLVPDCDSVPEREPS